MQPEYIDVIADVIADEVKRATEPLLARIALLESREPLKGQDGVNGKDVDPVLVQLAVDQAVAKAVAAIRPPKDGEPGRPGDRGEKGERGEKGADAAVDLEALAHKVVALLPVPKDGQDGQDGKDAPLPDLDALVQRVLALIRVPKDGRDGVDGKDAPAPDLDVIAMRAAALVPAPVNGERGEAGTPGRDGKDCDLAVVKSFVEAEAITMRDRLHDDLSRALVERIDMAIKALPKPADGKDGIGLAGAVITKDGELAITLSDGSVRHLGVVIGANGADGRDGQDGVDFDDVTETFDPSTKVVTREYRKGDRVKTISYFDPRLYFRGVFGDQSSYLQGDVVAKKGLWHANRNTSSEPGNGNPDWTLIVKQGPEGRQGPKGEKGEPGRDHPAWFDPK